MELQIRRPVLKNLEEISKLFLETVTNNFKDEGLFPALADQVDEEVASLINTLKSDFETNGKETYFLIALFQNQIVGTVAYGPISKILTDNLSNTQTNIPEIKSVYVPPKFQGQGIGSVLFEKILEILSEHGIPAFYLDSGYQRAQQYWTKKLGLPSQVLKNYWSGGNHHMIWYRQVDATLG